MASKRKNEVKKALITLGIMSAACSSSAFANIPSYKDTFISYDNPDYVNSLLQYSSDNQVGGLIMWEATGDLDPLNKDSLLYQVANTQVSYPPKKVELFWPDWSTERNYGDDGHPLWGDTGTPKYRDSLSGQKIIDQILAASKNGSQAIIDYAFVETNPNGSLVVHDPWADLQSKDKDWCSGTATTDDQGNSYTFCATTPSTYTTSFGSIDKFLNLRNAPEVQGLAKQPLLILSLGGWMRSADVDRAINNRDKFFTSWQKLNDSLVNTGTVLRGFDGINFDYEGTGIHGDDFSRFAKFVIAFHAKFPDAFISIDISVNDASLRNIKKSLKLIYKKDPEVQFDVMSYDFHGAFDFSPTDDSRSVTGLLNRIYDNRGKTDYSIQKAMRVLIQGAKIPSNNISLGIAAYGRAISNITPKSGVLFNGQIPSSFRIPIEYDLDDHGPTFINHNGLQLRCAVTYPYGDLPGCDGIYPWSYIHDTMLKSGFNQKEVKSAGHVSGVYAQNLSDWTPKPPGQPSDTIAINIEASQYYYDSLTISNSLDKENVYLQKNLTAEKPISINDYSVREPATGESNTVSFLFKLSENSAYTEQCSITLPKSDGNVNSQVSLDVKRVDNPYGGKETRTCEVTISTPSNPGNKKPTPEISTSTNLVKGDTIELNGSTSEGDGGIVSYQWVVTHGSKGVTVTDPTQAKSSFVAGYVGTYTVTLKVTDRSGLSASKSLQITIQSKPSPSDDSSQVAMSTGGYSVSVGGQTIPPHHYPVIIKFNNATKFKVKNGVVFTGEELRTKKGLNQEIVITGYSDNTYHINTP